MRITEQQLEAIQNKRNNAQKGTLQRDKIKSDARVLGRLKQGAMNKTERKYNDYLESKRMKGEILWFKFDCINLRLAEKTFYKPDFSYLQVILSCKYTRSKAIGKMMH